MAVARPGFKHQWKIIEILLFFHAATFVLLLGKDGIGEALGVFPATFWQRPWTAFTHQFVHGESFFWFLINLFVLWIMGKALETEWGSPRFLAFYLVSLLSPVVTGLLFNTPVVGNQWVDLNLLLAFALFFPDYEFLIFFVLPVKVKYLAWIVGGLTIFGTLRGHLFTDGAINGLIHVVGLFGGFLFLMAQRKIPTTHKIAYKARQVEGGIKSGLQRSDQASKNAALDERVRAAESAAGTTGELDQDLLAELDAAVDPAVTICEPADFGYVDDDVCKSCSGYPECAARRIRLAAEAEDDGS